MLGGVLIDVHLVHLGGVGQLGELVLWNVGEALGLQGMQVGDVLTWECKCIIPSGHLYHLETARY